MHRRLILVAACCAVALVAWPARASRCIRGPYLQNAAVGSVEVRWELDRLGRSSLEVYTGAETPRKLDSPFDGRKHRVRLTGLRPGETYRYRILTGSERVTDELSFRAVPAGPSRFTFAVFGDFGAGTRGQMQVAKLLDRSTAELALLTGDLIYGRGEEEHYDTRFFEPYRKSLRRMTFWPALGNHDNGTKQGAPLLALFDVPANGPLGLQTGRNYSFDYGNAHFVAFDSNAARPVLQKTIGPWLAADLKASKQPWKFVFMHHPPYSSANHGEDARIRDVMVPFFQQGKVDVVFSGHDHSYERTRPQAGITYIVSGNGGQSLYSHKNPHDYTAAFYNAKHGLTEVTLDDRTFQLRHINVDGKEVDKHEIRKD
ncbi:MAG: metallophosphoesterase [Armatimonadetes bacterium]|jgi:hypothetical protein|nr:metallophosphoesterase [Armatimonadota bacterium]